MRRGRKKSTGKKGKKKSVESLEKGHDVQCGKCSGYQQKTDGQRVFIKPTMHFIKKKKSPDLG